MPPYSKKRTPFALEEELAIRELLSLIESDALYKTEGSYIADGLAYPDHHIPFVEKHMSYLNSHPSVSPGHYLSNLRLKLKIRT